jgi:hypothetical protein
MVASGQVGATELSKFYREVETGDQTLYEAWDKVHEAIQEQQAAQQQPPEGGGPQPGSPEAQPGLAAPGVQAAQGLPQPGPAAGVSQPQPGIQHMQQLVAALKGGTRPQAQPNA